jgi:5-(carboxyamino)imidazole ribonucleotide mutase
VPVATVAINGATNAGLLCVRMLATHDEALAAELEAYRLELADQAKTQDENLPRA